MRFAAGLSFVLCALLMQTGCGTKSGSPLEPKSKMTKATEKIGEAAELSTAAAKEKRDLYMAEMKKRMTAMDVQYEDLKDRAAKAGDQAKIGLEKTLAEAKVKRDAAAKHLDELKDASADRWDKVKDGVETAFGDLKKIFD